jgi:hypothetical protein
MPLFTKNFIIEGEGVVPTPPPKPIIEEIPMYIFSPKVENIPANTEIYHIVKDESLEKLYNKKSPYLVDMVSIDLK